MYMHRYTLLYDVHTHYNISYYFHTDGTHGPHADDLYFNQYRSITVIIDCDIRIRRFYNRIADCIVTVWLNVVRNRKKNVASNGKNSYIIFFIREN